MGRQSSQPKMNVCKWQAEVDNSPQGTNEYVIFLIRINNRIVFDGNMSYLLAQINLILKCG